MRAWATVLGGLAIWAAHFFLLYAIASVLPGRPEARWLVLAVTLPAVAGEALMIRRTMAGARRPDELDAWIARLGTAGAGLSLVAVVWQAVPAVAL